MKANVLRDALGNITIYMQGDLDYEYSLPFRDELKNMAKNNPNAKITVDLGAVEFIGSSGICHFVETIQTLNRLHKGTNPIRVSNTTHEFNRIFRLYTQSEAEVFWDEFEMENDDTRHLNTLSGNRKNTFEN